MAAKFDTWVTIASILNFVLIEKNPTAISAKLNQHKHLA